MSQPVTRDEFTRRWLLICLTCAIFGGLMFGYVAAMEYFFDVKMSDQAVLYLAAAVVNIVLFVYLRHAVVPRMQTRGRSGRYAVAMHAPLLVYANIAILAFELKPKVLDDLGLNFLAVAGLIMAMIVFIEAAYLNETSGSESDGGD